MSAENDNDMLLCNVMIKEDNSILKDKRYLLIYFLQRKIAVCFVMFISCKNKNVD